MDDEKNILARLKLGDPLAFDELVRIYQPMVTRLAHRLLGWRTDVDDVVQDVFFAAYRSLKGFRGDSAIGTWLTKVTINHCRQRQRRQAIWKRWFRQQRSLKDADNPAVSALKEELPEAVRAAMQMLTAVEREILVLYYLEELPVKQIAEMLEITPGAADVRLHRARNALRLLLHAHVEEPNRAR